MSSIAEDQRKSPRIDFNLDVRVKGREGFRQVRNLGLYGVFVRLESPDDFQRGDVLYIDMTFPHENQTLSLEGRIAHISDRGVGVEFADLRPQDAMSMESCFNIFRHSRPMPGT